MATMQCQRCKQVKDETEFHWKWKDVERLKICKECRKQDSKRYRDGSLEKRVEYNRKYVAAHREDVTEYMRKYHSDHREDAKRRREANAEKLAERAARYYYEHKSLLQENKRKWSREHPDRDRHYAKKRNAIRRGADIVDFTDKQWREVLDEYNHSCAYCGAHGVQLEQDHVCPVSRHGDHTKSNIVPACKSCNSSKKDRTLAQWKRTVYFRTRCMSSKL